MNGRAYSTPFRSHRTTYGFSARSEVSISGEHVGSVSYYTDASDPKVCVALAEGDRYSYYEIRRGLTRPAAKKTAYRLRIRMVRAIRRNAK